MRLCLSCLGCSSFEKLPTEDSDTHNGDFIRSIGEFMKPTCSWKDKTKWKVQQNEHLYHQLKEAIKERSLEELLFADSPGKNDDNIRPIGGEYNFFRQLLKRICQPFGEDCEDFTPKARESVSTEKLLKLDSGETDVSSIITSQSGKVRKRVSFRFPSEADIIIFYSSDVESDED